MQYKGLAERAAAQVSETDLHLPLDEHTNSIAVIMQHLAGNFQSRWMDVLTSDGEKPWRDRDQEFVDQKLSREQLLMRWYEGWSTLLNALDVLSSDDLARSITIRGYRLTVNQAIIRALGHCAYHVGQIVTIARIHAGENWQTLTIPPGQSRQYNDQVWNKSDL